MVDKNTDSEELARRIGRSIATRRKSLGLTQDRLAERMGVDAETISRFERGAHLPSLPTLERLAIALRVEVGELLTKARISKADDAARLAAWMDGLSTEDRRFVLAVAHNCCDHLRQKSSGTRRQKS